MAMLTTTTLRTLTVFVLISQPIHLLYGLVSTVWIWEKERKGYPFNL
nr:MAG TPA_asm: hypothetical protein [Caudoviricetes sp.]